MGTTKIFRAMGLCIGIGVTLSIATMATAQDAGLRTHRSVLLAQWEGGQCVEECRDTGSRCADACEAIGEPELQKSEAGGESRPAFRECQRDCVNVYQLCKNHCRY